MSRFPAKPDNIQRIHRPDNQIERDARSVVVVDSGRIVLDGLVNMLAAAGLRVQMRVKK